MWDRGMKMGKRIAKWAVMWICILLLTACGKSVEDQIAEQLDLGQKYFLDLQCEEAIVAFSKVIELDEKNVTAHLGLGKVYEAQGDAASADSQEQAAELYQKAIEQYEIVQELDSSEPESYERLVILYQELEDFEKLQQLLNHYQGEGKDEDLAASLELMETLKGLCKKGELEQILELIKGEQYKLLCEKFLDGKILILELEEGRGLGVYPVEDEVMIYYGDYVDGKRSGKGVWLGDDYRAEGEWLDDLPNGNQEEYISNDFNRKGTVVEGLWNGPAIEYRFYEEDGETFVDEVSFTNGRYDILFTMEDNGEIQYVISDTEDTTTVIFEPEKIRGIRGFGFE